MSYYLTEILKIGRYQQITPVSISYFIETEVFCVSFLIVTRWFTNEKDAIEYASYLNEKYFFLNYPNKIRIKKYTINNKIHI